MESKINAWLKKHGRTFKEDMGDGDVWYDDFGMVDSAMHDLGLNNYQNMQEHEANRRIVQKLVDQWIQSR